MVDPDTEANRKKLNQLAREQMKLKLLQDIRVDLEICKLEGWSITEYIRDLQRAMNSLLK